MRWSLAMTLSVLLLIILQDHTTILWKFGIVAIVYFVVYSFHIAEKIAYWKKKDNAYRNKNR